MQPDKKSIAAHINFLFGDVPTEYEDGRIEVAYTGAHTKALNQANYFGLDEIEKAVDFIAEKNTIEGINVYIGAALRTPDCPPFGRSSANDYYAAPALWADIDDPEAAESAKQAYTDIPPHLIVVTGRSPHKRFQAWWKLDKPETQPDEAKQSLSGLRHALNGDPSVVDAARVMRVGGTVAWPKKEGRVTEATEVVMLETKPIQINVLKHSYPPTMVHDTKTGQSTIDDGKPRNIFTGQLEVTKLLEATRQQGHWNENMLIAIASMIGRHWSDEQIRLACAPYSYGAHNDQDIIDIINRTRLKFGTPSPEFNPETGEIKPTIITAVNISELDLDNVPQRGWLFGTIAARKFVTMIGASPGAGKSIFTMQLGVAASANKPFGAHTPQEDNIKTWIYNNEEGEEELRRRLKGILMHAEIKPKELESKLYMNSGEAQSICLARRNLEGGGIIQTPDFEAMKQEVIDKKIDLLIIDPFAETHDLNENSNDEMKRIAGLYRQIAIECNCAVVLVHHTRKGGSQDSQSSEHHGNMDNLRGGGAQLGVVRRVFTLAKMDDKAAKEMGVSPSAKRWFVRLDDSKTNITAPAESAEWFKFKSISIHNGANLSEGDSIGVLEHKTVEEIQSEEDDYSKQERQLLLERLARIMMQMKVYENSIRWCVDTLIEDGYGKYKARKLHAFLKQAVWKSHNKPSFACEGNSCKFSILESDARGVADMITLHIEELSCF